MNVELAVQQVLDDLMEADARGPFGRPQIIDKLNEGYQLLRSRILEGDPSGQWFAQEHQADYPAATRWAPLTLWSANGAPEEMYVLKAIISGRPVTVCFIDQREESNWVLTHGGDSYAAMLSRGALGLLVGGSFDPPPAAVTLRMSFLPPPEQINRTDASWNAEKIKVIGTDFPFPNDFASALVAYAVVLLTMKQESASSREWKARYDQLEEALLRRVRRGRQHQNLPEVRIENPWDYQY